ncbi:hypothetical protein Bca4012_062282 [Brassica carinata]
MRIAISTSLFYSSHSYSYLIALSSSLLMANSKVDLQCLKEVLCFLWMKISLEWSSKSPKKNYWIYKSYNFEVQLCVLCLYEFEGAASEKRRWIKNSFGCCWFSSLCLLSGRSVVHLRVYEDLQLRISPVSL